MSEYYDVYRKRSAHLGITPQERAFNSGILEFKRTLHYDQHTVRNLKCRDLYFDGIILTDKQDENRVSQILHTELNVEIGVGDMVIWDNSPWLIYKKTISSYQPYNQFYMVQCNYVINWVDTDGILHSSAARVIGSKDSKIKDNFRTWNELITPQPNKFIEVIMPYQFIEKTREIILYEEAWTLVDYDRVSVPGIIYLSFTESKVNELRDDVAAQIANIDKLQDWSINAPLSYSMKVGEEFTPSYTLLKNGIVQPEARAEIIPGEGLTLNDNGTLSCFVEGETELILKYGNIMLTQKVIIGDSPALGYINGNSYIRVGRSDSYSFVSATGETIEGLEFSLEAGDALATVENTLGGCVVKANERNKLGTITLAVDYDGQHYTKTINIISLWQEA